MDKILKALEDVQQNVLSLAKSLKDGNTEEAISHVEATVDSLKKTVEAVKVTKTETEEETPAPTEEETPAPTEEETPEATPADGEEVKKTVTIELNKTQEIALKKWVDMYVSDDDFWAVLEAMKNFDFSLIKKTVEDTQAAVAELEK